MLCQEPTSRATYAIVNDFACTSTPTFPSPPQPQLHHELNCATSSTFIKSRPLPIITSDLQPCTSILVRYIKSHCAR
jgi:hypothetical protein